MWLTTDHVWPWLKFHHSFVDRKPTYSNPQKWFCFDPSCHLKYPVLLFTYSAALVTFSLCLWQYWEVIIMCQKGQGHLYLQTKQDNCFFCINWFWCCGRLVSLTSSVGWIDAGSILAHINPFVVSVLKGAFFSQMGLHSVLQYFSINNKSMYSIVNSRDTMRLTIVQHSNHLTKQKITMSDVKH